MHTVKSVTNVVFDTDPTVQVFTGQGLLGLAILNAAAAAATISIYDGTADTDPRIFHAKAAANMTEGIAGATIYFRTGVYVVTTGAGSDAQIGIT